MHAGMQAMSRIRIRARPDHRDASVSIHGFPGSSLQVRALRPFYMPRCNGRICSVFFESSSSSSFILRGFLCIALLASVERITLHG
jgi:hypothetical protein